MSHRLFLGIPVVAAVVAMCPGAARADELVIKHPGDHPSYVFEAEPHALVGFWGPFAKGSAAAGNLATASHGPSTRGRVKQNFAPAPT